MQLKLNIFPKLIVLFISIFLISNVMAYEEPQYTVIKKNSVYEIRYYKDRLAVQTTYNSDGGAFRKLFNYISGSNKRSNKKNIMTSITESEKIAMTIPVTQTEEGKKMVMQFYLPSNYTIESAPIPNDSKVKIVNIEGGHFAVIQYSGRSTEKNFIKHKRILREKLIDDGIEIKSNGIKATYNGPFTIPILRRNEAMFKINIK